MVSVEESEIFGTILNALEFINNTYVKDEYAKQRIKNIIIALDEVIC